MSICQLPGKPRNAAKYGTGTWTCTRKGGHTGPCSAEVVEGAPNVLLTRISQREAIDGVPYPMPKIKPDPVPEKDKRKGNKWAKGRVPPNKKYKVTQAVVKAAFEAFKYEYLKIVGDMEHFERRAAELRHQADAKWAFLEALAKDIDCVPELPSFHLEV